MTNEIKCWHKEIDENGICKNCGARAAIELEGLHPSGTKSLDMLRVSNSTEKEGEMSNKQFIAWWNSNWPDLAPTHQALHAWKAAQKLLTERIRKAKAILEVTALDSESSWARIKAKEALEALEGK